MSGTVAVVTCAGLNVDPDQPLLLEALSAATVDASAQVWDDTEVRWENFDLVVLRSPWDYAARRAEFLTWAKSVPRLLNPYSVIEKNTDKHYLAELAAAGVAVIATTFCDVGQRGDFPTGSFVVKPTVGAGSMDAERYNSETHDAALAHVARLHALGRDVMIQPYVSSVDTDGEIALIFIDGQFAHAMRKGAMLNVDERDRNNLFRREQMARIEVGRDEVSFALDALGALDAKNLLYARVDIVRERHGWAVMEIELTEPSLFLWFNGDAATQLASAIAHRL